MRVLLACLLVLSLTACDHPRRVQAPVPMPDIYIHAEPAFPRPITPRVDCDTYIAGPDRALCLGKI